MAAGWRGYGPGLAGSLLSLYVAPYAFNPHFTVTNVDLSRVVQTLLISGLASTVAASQRRAQAALRRGNEDLESRVARRTAELEAVNQALVESDRRLHDVLNSVDDSFLALDREWRFTFVNHRIARSLGKQVDDVVGRVIWDVFPEARDSEFYPQYCRVMEERVSVQFEMAYPATGEWLQVSAHPTAEGLSAYVVDITQRKKDEVNLARHASIVESSGDAIISKSLDGTVLTWNTAAERIYGYGAAEIIGDSIEKTVPADRIEEERNILAQLQKGERVEHYETVRLRRDGVPIDVSLTVSPIRDQAGQVIGASHIARDITEQKNFERQLQQMQKLESLGVLAGGVAHDFNNLLVGIVGNASLVLDDVPPQNRKPLEDVIASGERAADLTRQLLAYAGKGSVHSRLLDLSGLVREISALVRTSIPRSVQLQLDLGRELPPVMADSGQIQQIVMNLVINAAEAIGPDKTGSVIVTTGVVEADEKYFSTSFAIDDLGAGRYVMLEVQDTGCGMDEATVARIFDPFFTTKFLGRGLGLSAVVGIARSHGGAIKVYSVPDRGTTFRVLLPAAQGSAEQNVRTPSTESLLGTGLILLVDDEETVRKVARSSLERHGYTVREAQNGAAAVEALREGGDRFCAVLLDLTMPVMGGEEALRHISYLRPELPVVLSSGFNEMEAMRRFAGKGVAAFLQKPYTAVQLARVIRGAIEPSASAAAS